MFGQTNVGPSLLAQRKTYQYATMSWARREKVKTSKVFVVEPALTIDQSVLVPQALSFEILLVGGIVQLLEDVFEAAIVFFEDCVLGA